MIQMKKQIGFLLFFLTLASAALCYGAEAQPTMNQIISDSVIFEFDTPIAYVRGTRQTMDVDLLLSLIHIYILGFYVLSYGFCIS